MVPDELVKFLTFLGSSDILSVIEQDLIIAVHGNDWILLMIWCIIFDQGFWDTPVCDGRLTFRDAGSSTAVIAFCSNPVVGEPSEAIELCLLSAEGFL